jgi:hypothetical protein
MALRWKDKIDVSMLSSIHDNGIEAVHDKCGLKQKPKVCIDYTDTVGGIDISAQYL